LTISEIPGGISELSARLAASGGVSAVVLGGSQASGEAGPDSDWDLGVYYRGTVDLAPLTAFGEVHPPGSWGRIMNGGAWLVIDDVRVDVLLRDLDVVEHWSSQARAGRYDVDGLLGYVAGIPTYSLLAEVAGALVLHGLLEGDTAFPPALRDVAPGRWRYHRDFSLTYAVAQARRGNPVGAIGQCARAIFEEAHARRCESGRWSLNEKRLLDGCGLDDASAALVAFGRSSSAQLASVELVRDVLTTG
jgi:Nucleotidyltransferase domain